MATNVKQVHIWLDKQALHAVDILRRKVYPTPSVAEVLRQAVVEKAARESETKRKAKDE